MTVHFLTGFIVISNLIFFLLLVFDNYKNNWGLKLQLWHLTFLRSLLLWWAEWRVCAVPFDAGFGKQFHNATIQIMASARIGVNTCPMAASSGI